MCIINRVNITVAVRLVDREGTLTQGYSGFFYSNSVTIFLGVRLLKGRDFPRDNSFMEVHCRRGPSPPRALLESVRLNDVRGTSCSFLILPFPLYTCIERFSMYAYCLFLPFHLIIHLFKL